MATTFGSYFVDQTHASVGYLAAPILSGFLEGYMLIGGRGGHNWGTVEPAALVGATNMRWTADVYTPVFPRYPLYWDVPPDHAGTPP